MEYRRLNSQDFESYFANRLRALQQTPSAFLVTYAEAKEGDQSHYKNTLACIGKENLIFGALNEGQVVATLGLSQEERSSTKHKAIIWGMAVDIEYRKRGIAAKLLDMAIQFAKDEMKVKLVQLSVEANNLPARKLYESRGFKIWGTEPKTLFINGNYYDDDHMALVF